MAENKKISREALLQEKQDVQDLRSHLEEEYRKAEISERNYDELMVKYNERVRYIDKTLGIASGDMPDEELEPEAAPKKAAKPAEAAEEPEEEAGADGKEEPPAEKPEEEKPKKGGLFSKLLKKKEGAQEAPKEEKAGAKKKDETEPDLGGLDPSSPEGIERLSAQLAGQSGVEVTEEKEEPAEASGDGTQKDIEIEKLKLMLDTMREGMKNTDDSMRNLAESIGEIRSMVFQEDSSLKEEGTKMEKIETEIGEVKPKEIESKFREIKTKLEQGEISAEKFQRKSEDLAEKVNKVYEMMKKIGGVENLITIDKDIQQKIDDIKEALKYTERLALKTEKMFIDLNRGIQDMVVYKTRQEGLDETVRDLIKSVDGINSRLNDMMTKKDLENTNQDILILHNHLDEINKVMPLLEAKMPESVAALRNERNNIMLFMDSLKEHYKTGKITSMEFEEAKRKNASKLVVIEDQLREEWRKLQGMISGGALPKEQPAQEGAAPAEESDSPSPSIPPAPPGGEAGAPEEAPEAAEKKGPGKKESKKKDEKEKPVKKSKPKKKEKKRGGKGREKKHAEKKHAPKKAAGKAPAKKTPAAKAPPAKAIHREKPPTMKAAQAAPEKKAPAPEQEKPSSSFLEKTVARLGEKEKPVAKAAEKEGDSAEPKRKKDDKEEAADMLSRVREKMK